MPRQKRTSSNRMMNLLSHKGRQENEGARNGTFFFYDTKEKRKEEGSPFPLVPFLAPFFISRGHAFPGGQKDTPSSGIPEKIRYLYARNTPNPSYIRGALACLWQSGFTGRCTHPSPSLLFWPAQHRAAGPCKICCLFIPPGKRYLRMCVGRVPHPGPEVKGLSRHKCPADTYSTFP